MNGNNLLQEGMSMSETQISTLPVVDLAGGTEHATKRDANQ
jgi:hypothetical protein